MLAAVSQKSGEILDTASEHRTERLTKLRIVVDSRKEGNDGPVRRRTSDHQCLNFVVQAIPKQNQNTQKKVPTTQPNPQYSAKNNVTMHMIDTFMPPPSHILACLKYYMIMFQQYLSKF